MKNLVPSNDQHLLLSNCSSLGHTFSIFFVEQLSVKPNENSYLIVSAYISSLWTTWSLTVFGSPTLANKCISSVESVAVGLLHHLIKVFTRYYFRPLHFYDFLQNIQMYNIALIAPVTHIVQTWIQNCYKGVGWGWENLRKKTICERLYTQKLNKHITSGRKQVSYKRH